MEILCTKGWKYPTKLLRGKVFLLLLFMSLSVIALAQARRLSPVQPRVITYGTPPSGYERLGDTNLYYMRKQGGIDAGGVSLGSIDIVGRFGDNYYSSTYGNNGYVVSMQVGNKTASFMDCLEGGILDGVAFRADIEQQGDLAKVYYTLTNTTENDLNISLGVYDDVAVGETISPNIWFFCNLVEEHTSQRKLLP